MGFSKVLICCIETMAFLFEVTAEKNAKLLHRRSKSCVFLNRLLVHGNLKKLGAIVICYQSDHHCVSDHSWKYPAGLNPGHCT